jgi:Tol biopolymer transport system component
VSSGADAEKADDPIFEVKKIRSSGITRDRRTLTWVDADENVWVAAADGTGEPEHLPGSRGKCTKGGRPAWGPDDSWFVQRCGPHDSSAGLFRRNVDGGRPQPLVDVEGNLGPWAPAVSENGRVVAYWSGGYRDDFGALHAFSVGDPSGTNRVLVSKGASDPAFSPKGSLLAFVTASGGRRLHVAQVVVDAQGIPRLEDDNRVGDITRVSRPTWSPDGERLAYRSGDGIYVIEAKGGLPHQVASIAKVKGTGVSPVWSAR